MGKKLGITLPLQRGANGYFDGTEEAAAQIRSNFTNLLLTQVGERLMQPDFGSELLQFIFQNETDEGLAGIQAAVETSAAKWLPFIKVGTVQITQNPNQNQIILNVPYTLLSNKITDSITLVF